MEGMDFCWKKSQERVRGMGEPTVRRGEGEGGV